MDYEKEYRELVAKLKNAYYDEAENDERFCCVMKNIMPEIAESEDEKIRKELVRIVDGYFSDKTSQQRKAYIAWLEKQGEKKNAHRKHVGMDLVEEKMTPFQKEVFCIVDLTQEEEKGLSNICNKLLSLAKEELEQKPEWSEEDEKNIQIIELSVNRCVGKWHCCGEECPIAKCLPWLKSLRPPYYCDDCKLKKSVTGWKPSEEQIMAVEAAWREETLSYDETKELGNLLEQLKAL